MRAIARWIGIIVLVLGVVSLAFGIVFIVMGACVKGDVVKAVKDENFPTVSYKADAPPLYLEMDMDNPIDTAAEIKGSAKAISDAMEKMHPAAEMRLRATRPVIVPIASLTTGIVTYTPVSMPHIAGAEAAMADQNWVNLLAFSGVLSGAVSALALGGLVQFIGIVSLIIGIALIVGGLALHRLIRGVMAMVSAFQEMMKT